MNLLNIKNKNGSYNKIRLMLLCIISIILTYIIILIRLILKIENMFQEHGTDIHCGSCVGAAPIFPWMQTGLFIISTIIILWVISDNKI